MENIELFSRGSLVKGRPSDDLSSLHDVVLFCRVCEPSKVLRLPAKTKVRHWAQRVESPVRWHVKKPRKTANIEAKIEPKSSKMAGRARLGGLVARLWALEGLEQALRGGQARPKRPDRASQGD